MVIDWSGVVVENILIDLSGVEIYLDFWQIFYPSGWGHNHHTLNEEVKKKEH